MICRWYDVAVRCLTPKYLQTSENNLLMNFSPLSVKKYVGVPNESIQWLRKIFTVCVGYVLDMRIARVKLKNRFGMTHMY